MALRLSGLRIDMFCRPDKAKCRYPASFKGYPLNEAAFFPVTAVLADRCRAAASVLT